MKRPNPLSGLDVQAVSAKSLAIGGGRCASRYLGAVVVLPFMPLLGGCGTSSPTPTGRSGTVSVATEPNPNGANPGDSPRTDAEEFVARNSSADTNLHLVARAFVNERTEVLSFYEPEPGRILLVGAGHPKGPSQLARTGGKTAEDWWRASVPGERVPPALLDAIGRQAAGVGKEHLVSLPASATESMAHFTGMEAASPTQKVLGSGYCDNGWFADFPPSQITGVNALTNSSNSPKTVGSFVAPFGVQALTYGPPPPTNNNNCFCSWRTVQSIMHVHAVNSAGSNATNEWENWANVCPAQFGARVGVTGSNWNQEWDVAEDTFIWLEDTGSVTCAFTTCLSTNDIGKFDVYANSEVFGNTGYINYMAEAYGP